MHFESYDYITGELIGNFDSLDFGDLIQGQHCSKPLVIRAVADTEGSVSNFRVFLESAGDSKDSQFGFFYRQDPPSSTPPIEAGSAYLSINHFIETPGADSNTGCPPGITPGWNHPASDYIWLDVQTLQTGATEANYRIFFDYT